jgi:hypothetical protein
MRIVSPVYVSRIIQSDVENHTPVGSNERAWHPVVNEKAYSGASSVGIAGSIGDAQIVLLHVRLSLPHFGLKPTVTVRPVLGHVVYWSVLMLNPLVQQPRFVGP